MNQKEIYKIIRCWEIEAGEGFIEYFADNACNLDEDEIMEWMFKKGYIDKKKLDLFKEDGGGIGVCDCFCAYEVDSALFPYGECDEEAIFKSELIIAEYLIEHKKENSLIEFAFEGQGWASFDSEEDKQDNKNALQKCINSWDEKDDKEYEKIINLKIEDINARLFEEHKN